MLVQFSFKNFGPFKDEAVLDMHAVKSYKEHPYNLIQLPNGEELLRVAALYGANASGKSNFVEAYRCFKHIIRHSFQLNNKEKKKTVLDEYHNPFLLDDDMSTANTEFEGIYSYGGYEYRYGYAYNDERIEYEWLYKKSYSTNRESKVFERNPERIDLGRSVLKTCEKYLNDIDSDVLALSFFSSLKLRNHIFQDVVYCVTDFLPLSLVDSNTEFMIEHYFREEFDDQEKIRLMKFLKGIDVGIQDIMVEKQNNKVSVYCGHRVKNHEIRYFPIEIESDGTLRAMALFSFVSLAIRLDKGLIIDEFNSRLHPLLQKYIIDLFYDEKTQGQLIYTTHDTAFLDRQYVRRDQVWFTSKNDDGESTLYSLAEFKIRNDKSFEKDYLGGTYGGIPTLKDASFLEE